MLCDDHGVSITSGVIKGPCEFPLLDPGGRAVSKMIHINGQKEKSSFVLLIFPGFKGSLQRLDETRSSRI